MRGPSSPDVGRPRRWGWRKVVALGLATSLVAVALVAGWLTLRYRAVEREPFPDGALQESVPSTPQNFLVVGSDSRDFVDSEGAARAFGTAEEVGAPHADTILLVRIFPEEKRAAIVSFPRDLLVTLPDTREKDRINTAIAGGPPRLVETLRTNFDIPVHHFVQVDFRGFEALVDAIGGVTIHFPAPARDWDEARQINPTGLDIAETGCVELDGPQALAFVRSRHYQQLIDGEWRSDPAGDLDRIKRQQEFLRQTLEQSTRRGLRNPARLNALIGVAVRNVRLDDELGFRDLTALGRQFRSGDATALETYALPTTPGRTEAGADVLFLDRVAADPVLDVFRGVTDRPAVLLPMDVTVAVRYPGGRASAGDAAAFRLTAAGLHVVDVAEEPGAGGVTVLRHAPGAEAEAALLASRLVSPPRLEAVEMPPGTDLVLVIGSDWGGVAGGPEEATPPGDPAAGVGDTTTTAAPPPSTTAPPPPTC